MAYDPLSGPPKSNLGTMGQRLLNEGWNKQFGAQRRFSAAAQRAQKAAMAEAFDAIGKAHGEELAGTPGFLAAKSMGPGGLARLRGKTLRSGVSRLASANYGIAADTAKSIRDFTAQHEMLKEKERIEKEKNKGGGFMDTLGRLGGAALGFVTGGPAGAVADGLAGSGAASDWAPSNDAYTPMPDAAEDLFRTGRTNNYYGYRQDPYRR